MQDYQVSPVKFSSLPLSTSCVLACSYRASETNKHPSIPGPYLPRIFFILCWLESGHERPALVGQKVGDFGAKI